MAAVDYFLKLTGIDGESQDKNHKGWIDIYGFSHGAVNKGTSHAGGGSGAGKVQMGDFHFQMYVNKASPKLLLACANGEPFKQAILVCRKAGKDQQEYLKYTFSDLLISHFQTGAGTLVTPEMTAEATAKRGAEAVNVVPMDDIAFNYSKIEYEYKEQKPDGTLGGAVKCTIDVKAMTFS